LDAKVMPLLDPAQQKTFQAMRTQMRRQMIRQMGRAVFEKMQAEFKEKF
jgi:hypothetical protein